MYIYICIYMYIYHIYVYRYMYIKYYIHICIPESARSQLQAFRFPPGSHGNPLAIPLGSKEVWNQQMTILHPHILV